jgi:hypothetical protein
LRRAFAFGALGVKIRAVFPLFMAQLPPRLLHSRPAFPGQNKSNQQGVDVVSKRDDLIAKYAEDLRTKCQMEPDIALLTKVTIGCGPAIYNADSSTVAGSDNAELETVKKNYLMKKLGLADSPALMEGINAVINTYGKSEPRKHRAVIYYMLAKHFKKESVYA